MFCWSWFRCTRTHQNENKRRGDGREEKPCITKPPLAMSRKLRVAAPAVTEAPSSLGLLLCVILCM